MGRYNTAVVAAGGSAGGGVGRFARNAVLFCLCWALRPNAVQ